MVLRTNQPGSRLVLQVALELGGYIGYSAIHIAQSLPPGGKLYSIEPNETHVRIARHMIQHAGLSDKVEVLQSILTESVQASHPDCYKGNPDGVLCRMYIPVALSV